MNGTSYEKMAKNMEKVVRNSLRVVQQTTKLNETIEKLIYTTFIQDEEDQEKKLLIELRQANNANDKEKAARIIDEIAGIINSRETIKKEEIVIVIKRDNNNWNVVNSTIDHTIIDILPMHLITKEHVENHYKRISEHRYKGKFYFTIITV